MPLIPTNQPILLEVGVVDGDLTLWKRCNRIIQGITDWAIESYQKYKELQKNSYHFVI